MKKPSFLYVLLTLMGSLSLSVSYGMFEEEQDKCLPEAASPPPPAALYNLDPGQNPYPTTKISFTWVDEIDETQDAGGTREQFKGIRFTYSFIAKDGSQKVCLLSNVPPGDGLTHLSTIFRDKHAMKTYMNGKERSTYEIKNRYDQALARWKKLPGWSTYLLFEKITNTEADSPEKDPAEVETEISKEDWALRGQVMLEPSDRGSPEDDIPKHPRQPTEVELSYVFLPRETPSGPVIWNQGFGTAAVHALLTYLVPDLCRTHFINQQQVTSIFATTRADNPGSRWVLWRNGFHPTCVAEKFGYDREFWERSLTSEPLARVSMPRYWADRPDLADSVFKELIQQAQAAKAVSASALTSSSGSLSSSSDDDESSSRSYTPEIGTPPTTSSFPPPDSSST